MFDVYLDIYCIKYVVELWSPFVCIVNILVRYNSFDISFTTNSWPWLFVINTANTIWTIPRKNYSIDRLLAISIIYVPYLIFINAINSAGSFLLTWFQFICLSRWFITWCVSLQMFWQKRTNLLWKVYNFLFAESKYLQFKLNMHRIDWGAAQHSVKWQL